MGRILLQQKKQEGSALQSDGVQPDVLKRADLSDRNGSNGLIIGHVVESCLPNKYL